MTTLWATKKQDFVQIFNSKNLSKYGPDPDLDPEPKLFRGRTRYSSGSTTLLMGELSPDSNKYIFTH